MQLTILQLRDRTLPYRCSRRLGIEGATSFHPLVMLIDKEPAADRRLILPQPRQPGSPIRFVPTDRQLDATPEDRSARRFPLTRVDSVMNRCRRQVGIQRAMIRSTLTHYAIASWANVEGRGLSSSETQRKGEMKWRSRR